MKVSLRETQDGDLPIFWEQLTDPQLQYMAAATRKYHYDRAHFDQFWASVRSNPTVLLWTVLADGVVAGYASVGGSPSEREVSYVVGRAYWGRGIASQALAELIRLEETRPLHATAAADNVGSIRVLEKCGFVMTGSGRDFARARGQEIDVVHLKLS
ncbi:GNAT family N-acetyltransferase [Streptomyces brasiliensis]|uniref:N-acetyltransferase n=1 Tax=Streptomyces brasiliensis TaxID=1954 RepID=A0A917P5X1_9ACTN|nr:GNAT family N-acetyltransferase [Streptomyces brasiliensis]GGJ63273.1 N-acetyltransferase [Streptomyces brasiliensis]